MYANEYHLHRNNAILCLIKLENAKHFQLKLCRYMSKPRDVRICIFLYILDICICIFLCTTHRNTCVYILDFM